MTGTTERPGAEVLTAAALGAAWDERVRLDAGFDGDVRGLLAAETTTFQAVVSSVTAVVDGRESDGQATAGGSEAFSIGRAAHAHRLDLSGLQRLYGHLHDELSGQLVRRAVDAAGSLSGGQAEQIARRARAALERPIVEATRGWFDEAGRKLRHDVKTPLQATSLNLELLTLESAERGLDTEALDTIQGSLDQVVELLARAEPAGG